MRRLTSAGPLALILACSALLLAGSAAGELPLVLIGCVGLLVGDELHERTSDPKLLNSFLRIEAGLGWRAFFRQTMVVIFLLRAAELSTSAQVAVVIAVVARHAVLVLFLALRTFIGWRRMRRCETRNLGMRAERLPEPPPPPWLTEYGARLIINCDVLVAAALAIAFFSGSYSTIAPAALAAAVIACIFPVRLVAPAVAVLGLPRGEKLLAEAQDAVLRLGPVVILHFSGGIDSIYQVNMWLETMERLDRPVLVLLRERRYLDRLAPTTLPVLCLPFAIDLMNFRTPSARIALYVANVGKNIHLLRDPGLKSAFIGHGDSDKTASFNPFTKVYDEVWVAGEAGRQRYLRAQVGVRDDQIVLVGRPQLDAIQPARPRPEGSAFTVLYAPTWEGWTDNLGQSSLIAMGLQIVRELVDTEGVRVLFKPHPLTGTVDPQGQAVCREIAALLTASGPQHVYVDSARPLYDCFDESDALVSDISSVVSDYLWSEKPYFVTNNANVPDDQFRDDNPSAAAAYLIAHTAEGLADGLSEARGCDSFRDRRRDVRTYLLGDPDSNAMNLFRQSVEDLVEKANAHPSRQNRSTAQDDTLLDELASASVPAASGD